MQEEYLDIVDENGNLTGEKELRSVVHEKGLWHWVVPVCIYRMRNNQLEFLVQLRSKNKDQYPNKWQTRFGGHIEAGSTKEKSVIKEIEEEIGLRINLEELTKGMVFSYDSYKEKDPFSNREYAQIYYYNFKGDLNELSFNDGEVQKVKWMTENKVIESINKNPKIWASDKTAFIKILEDMKKKI